MKSPALSGLILGIFVTSLSLWLLYFYFDTLPMLGQRNFFNMVFVINNPDIDMKSVKIRKGEMGLAINAQGKALIDFFDGNGGRASYRWRYSSHFRQKERLGAGLVFKDTPALHPYDRWDVSEDSYMRAGPIRLRWAACSSTCSYLYYNPALVKISVLQNEEFDSYEL